MQPRHSQEGFARRDWRSSLSGYLGSGAETSESSGEPGETPGAATIADSGKPHTPLALQFELRELIPRTTFSWNGPTSRAATRTESTGSGDYRLGVRPVARTDRGWARGNITWSNIPHMLNRYHLDPGQHRWFCQFVAMHRAGIPIVAGNDSDWVFLDEFANPMLWQFLEQARSLNIQLVGSKAAVRVIQPSQATLRLDATQTSAGVRIAPRLTFDDVAVPVESARPIGTHGIYSYDLSKPHTYTLAPVAEPLTADHTAMLDPVRPEPAALTVPDDDLDEFVRNFLPALRMRVDIDSSDASVTLPPPPPPVLVITAEHGPAHSLRLSLGWEHAGHGPLDVPSVASLVPAGLLPEGIAPEDIAPEGLVSGSLPTHVMLSGLDAAEFVVRAMPLLRDLPGVRVNTVGTQPDFRELTGTPLLTVTTVPTEKHDWFDLGIIVTVDGHDIPFAPLFKALAAGQRRLLLVDGSYMTLSHPAFVPLAALIEEAKNLAEWESRPLINRRQVSLWADLEDLADESIPAQEWRKLLADVGEDSPRAIHPPAGLRAQLRPYQQEGFAWLTFLWRQQLGGILADDMGLGKTIQCLALIQHVAKGKLTPLGNGKRSPFLVVAPTSVVSNWAAEAKRFTPGLVVSTITATETKSMTSIADAASEADVIVTSYALFRLNFEAYQAVAQGTGWAGLILDEAQFVKNATSRVHECALDLETSFKLAVTGTPMENSLRELHALCAITAPGLFASARRFAEEYVRPIEAVAAGISRGRGAGKAPAAEASIRAEQLAKLRRRVRPFMLRRTKETVAPELPVKQEQTLLIELCPEHRALYDLFLQRERQKLFGLLEDLDRHRFIVFRSLTLLRMLSLDASLLGEEYEGIPSSKMEALVEQLDDVVAEGHRALVFSQFTSYLRNVAARLDAEGIPYCYLDGSTLKRDAVITNFKDGQAPVFLISLKAGGFGLNLTEADYVFLLDPWWNPASEQQAIDRTHRIGQDKNVMIYRLIAADTIEEKVMKLKERKAALFDAVIDDEALFSSALNENDIRELLS